MLFRSIFIIAVLISLVCVVFVQSEQGNGVSIHQLKAKFPLISDEDASQWLSTRNIPRRWRNQNINQQSDEINQTLKKLQALNDNGIRQFDTSSFEGVAMEVIFEMVSKNNAGSG
ncbi:unnamed protein product [Rotaria socialis]|uniref:Uncharacterized protein n=1 Tax=Rotaria socialis TaxID=392032 RepID=A0A818K6V5_9BILA|nr:unnamed protein product [Rotaria socialis]CAF3492348.1 unnamed protein product [Rotaria socialis]CAF3550703.1 unnamed protein product [Rotaria socialis]CAF4103923.1 unnamed protein product [Rotaria socialis]CAF4173470.1 unnamed protein product [Rotaria socialis]